MHYPSHRLSKFWQIEKGYCRGVGGSLTFASALECPLVLHSFNIILSLMIFPAILKNCIKIRIRLDKTHILNNTCQFHSGNEGIRRL